MRARGAPLLVRLLVPLVPPLVYDIEAAALALRNIRRIVSPFIVLPVCVLPSVVVTVLLLVVAVLFVFLIVLLTLCLSSLLLCCFCYFLFLGAA